MPSKRNNNMRRISHSWLWAMMATMLLAGVTQATELEVTEAKVSLLPGASPSAGYFNLHNAGDEPVTLVGAESPAFDQVHMHLSMDKDGVASMKMVHELELAPGETIKFAPKGYHLMLMNRNQPLAIGDEVEIVLQFAGEEPLPVNFDVVSPVSM